MSARSWWGAKADPKSAGKSDIQTGKDPGLEMDDLLDARFDDSGRLSQVGHGRRQRTAERLDPRPAEAGIDELDLAVQKLTEGLEAIERQSRARQPGRPAARPDAPAAAPGEPAGERDFVTYSLDRLEARLEALSKRLQQRSKSEPAPAETQVEPAERRPAPSLAVAPDDPLRAQLAEARRLADAEEARRAVIEAAEKNRQLEAAEKARRQAEEAADVRRRQAEIAEAGRQAEIAEAARQAEIAEARRQNEIAEARRQAELAEAKRQAEVAAARREAELAESRRRAEAEAAAEERRRRHAEAEAIRLADLAEARRNQEAAEARQRAETEEALRQAALAQARREAENAAALERQFAAIEVRIEAMQQGLDDNRVEPVRQELLDLVQQITDLSRSGRTNAESLTEIGTRLDEMEVKLNAARNMAGNRLGDIQDRLGGLVERLDEIEVEIPGFDAIRLNQSAILERFDRMEGLVHQLASPEELLDRVEALKRQMQTAASQREVARIEEQLLKLADRLDALPDDLSDKADFERIESQLGALATEFTDSRRQRKAAIAEMEERLAEISAQLRDVGETGRTPDLSGMEERIARLTSLLAEDRRTSSDALSLLERRLAALSASIEKQEGQTAILEGLTQKVDLLADAIDAQDSAGARRDIENLGRRLDQVAGQLSTQAEQLAQSQIKPIAARLDDIGGQIDEMSRRAPDQRALQAQFEGIVSRLELLKGRSLDPARLTELFDRVDAAIRAIPEDRFEQIGQQIKEAAIPAERFDRLEKKVAEAAAGASADRLAGLERKLDEIGRVVTAGGELLTLEDLTDLRSDIVALRRELRSLPGFAQGETSLGEMLRTIVKRLDRLPEQFPVTAADLEAHMDRIAGILEDPTHGRRAFAHIEASLKTIEERLEDARRTLASAREENGAPSVASIAQTLSDDVNVLKSSAETSERKTKDAIDAVQDTLEAVVKRMAFLERDSDTAAAERRAPERAAPPPLLREAAASERAVPERSAVAEAAPQAEPETEPVDLPPAGLLSRLTSRQLLRRATGGRAESFSPEPEDHDESSDFPLEPGTDAPLSSALTGAPSSNTEFMSGARKGRPQAFAGAAERADAPVGAAAAADDDFLAAARRAARAAAKEAADSADELPVLHVRRSGIAGALKSRAGALIAAAVAAAVVIAALLAARPDMLNGSTGIATLPEASAPVAEPESAVDNEPAASETAIADQPPAPGAPVAESEPAATAPSAVSSEETAAPAADGEEIAATTPEPAPASPSEPTEMASAESTAASRVAEPNAAAVPPSVSEAQPLAPTLPEEIGPARLRDAAVAGDRVAAFEVAARYAEGRGVLPDMPTAVLWYERAAEAGLAPAQYRLGSVYEKGLGVQKDLARAQTWYRRAADAGNVKAMHNLAVLYAEGAGGAPDLEKASELFRQAAERGVRDSQFNLAILHARGLGVPQDLIEAYKWFGIAASSGDAESAKRRDIIGEALSEDDRRQAEEAIATFQPVPLVSEANDVVMPEGGWSENDNSTSVQVKDQNELVALVQKLLAENGFDPGPADGLLGRQTTDAIAKFQTRAGLPKTGKIDDALVTALQAPST